MSIGDWSLGSFAVKKPGTIRVAPVTNCHCLLAKSTCPVGEVLSLEGPTFLSAKSPLGLYSFVVGEKCHWKTS